MALTPRMTLIGLYNYDSELFNSLTLPESIDKDIFINSLLMEYGETPLIYPNLDFMKTAIKVWSMKWYDSFERIAAALSEEYNPLHNFDRYEESQDTGTSTDEKSDIFSRKAANSGTAEDDRETVNTISAMNSNNYEPDNKTDDSLNHKEQYNQTIDDKRNTSGNGSRKDTHNGHLYGNIGVTTSQEMVKAELDLRGDRSSNIYHILSECFYHEFCIYVY